jgi:hypothetical protein
VSLSEALDMAKSHLAVEAPATEIRAAAPVMPRRAKSSTFRTREHLTVGEKG